MGTTLIGRAHFAWTDSGGFLHTLAVPLQRVRPAYRQRKWVRDSLDYTNREVWFSGGVHEILADVRYDDAPQSLIDLLAAGSRGVTVTYDDGYLSQACHLVEPVSDRITAGFDDFQQAEDWHTVTIGLRRTDGAAFGTATFSDPMLFRLSDVGSQFTFTRTGTVGPYTDPRGVLQSAAADEARWEWLYGLDGKGRFDTPSLLIEGSRTNLNDEDDLSNAAQWALNNTPVITSTVSDPAGGTGAFTVEDDDAVNQEFIQNIVAFTGDEVKSVVFVVRENTLGASPHDLKLRQTSGTPADRLDLEITSWSNGDPQVTANTGTFLGKRYVGGGYWAIYGQTTSVTAAETNRLQILPAQSATETGSIDVYRVNAYDAAVPGWSILDASEVRNAETWYYDLLEGQRPFTVLVDMLEWGTAFDPNNNLGVLQIGGAAVGDDPRFRIFSPSGLDGQYRALYDNGTATANATTIVGDAVAFGSRVEILVQFDYNEDEQGDIRIRLSENSGDLTDFVTDAGGGFGTGGLWNLDPARLHIGSGASTLQGVNPVIDVKIAAGVRTMDWMRNA